MTIAAETIKMTAWQYLQLGEDPPGVRLELVKGEIRVSPSPSVAHAYVVSNLLGLLGNHVEKHKLGEVLIGVDHVVKEFTVRRPDMFYFTRTRLILLGDRAVEYPPDLAVEIIGPGSRRLDRKEKFEDYAAFGIPYYWIIEPGRRTAEAFSLKRRKYVAVGSGKGRETVHFPPFEGLGIPLGELWWPPAKSGVA